MRQACYATMIFLLGVSTASAGTSVITFDSATSGETVRITGYVESGIVFNDLSNFDAVILADSGGVPSNGTPFLSKCGICRPAFEAADGGLFDLVGLDIGEHLMFGRGPFPTSVTITGVKEDGSIVQESLITDGLVGFESFELGAEFIDLVSADASGTSFFSAIGIDNIEVRAGIEKPSLTISPASGTYVTTQAFDLTLIVRGADSASIVTATLDGESFGDELAACVVEGTLDSIPGLSLRCPLDGAVLGEGSHSFEATLSFGDASTASDTTTWEIFGSSEPLVDLQ